MDDVPPIFAHDGPPRLVEEDGAVSLHFDDASVQSRMRLASPDELVLAYTRVMMGFLLLAPEPARVAMIGLGGGSLAKACHRVVPGADFTAVELSPEVIALRDVFGVPPDGERFRVLHGDGAAWVSRPEPGPALDVLLVDGFDRAGQPPALCSAAFYAACAARLRDGGVLVVNLNADATGYGSYARRIREAFAGHLVVVETADRMNKIVFARRGRPVPPLDVLLARAEAFEAFGFGLADTAVAIDRARAPGGRRRR